MNVEHPKMDSDSVESTFGSFRPHTFLSRKIEWARATSHSGVLYPISSLLRRWALHAIGNSTVDYDFRGMRVRFHPKGNTAEKRALLNPARFDPEELQFLETTLSQASVFLDIGANVGLYSLVAAKALGRDGKVIAFEPNPQVLDRLRFNISANRDHQALAPIKVEARAVTDRNGPVVFEPPANNLGEGRVVKDTEAAAGSLSVEGVKLETCLDESDISHIDVLKIDIEGHEIHALEPFLTEAPTSLHPEFMIVERGGEDHWVPLTELFRSAGYEPFKTCRMNEIWRKTS